MKSLSCVQLLATPWTAAYQAPPSMEFSRQEFWSGVPLPSPLGVLRKPTKKKKKKKEAHKDFWQWFLGLGRPYIDILGSMLAELGATEV